MTFQLLKSLPLDSFVQPPLCDRLHGLGLALLLVLEARALEHVEKIRIAAGVELIGPVEPHAPQAQQERDEPVGSEPPAGDDL